MFSCVYVYLSGLGDRASADVYVLPYVLSLRGSLEARILVFSIRKAIFLHSSGVA